MQTECQVAADPQTKPTDLDCEGAYWQLASTLIVAIYYYYSVHRLSLPSH